jgi:hypothetical protein
MNDGWRQYGTSETVQAGNPRSHRSLHFSIKGFTAKGSTFAIGWGKSVPKRGPVPEEERRLNNVHEHVHYIYRAQWPARTLVGSFDRKGQIQRFTTKQIIILIPDP